MAEHTIKKTSLFCGVFLEYEFSPTRQEKPRLATGRMAALRELQSDWSIRTLTPSRLEPGVSRRVAYELPDMSG